MVIRVAVVVVWAMAAVVPIVAWELRPLGDTYAILVSGIGKDPEDRAARDRVVKDFHSYLLDKASVRPDRLAVLVPDANLVGTSTAEAIRMAIANFASAANPADRFIFYYIGQANAVGEVLRFNLPGPDVTQTDLANWFAPVKAGEQLVVLDCPCAALAAKVLARPGRVLLLASTEKQPHAPQFGLHFVPALVQADSDADHDGRISVLEAFTATARGIERWYQERQLLPTETPCLEDDGDGRPVERPWRYESDGGDGRTAAGFFLTPGL